MNQKGFSVIILIPILILVAGLVWGFYFWNQSKQSVELIQPKPLPSVIQESDEDQSESQISLEQAMGYQMLGVDEMHAKVKLYYLEKGHYPQKLHDLKEVIDIADEAIDYMIKDTSLVYTSTGDTYDLYGTLSDGRKYRGTPSQINSILDQKVTEDVLRIEYLVDGYYKEKRLLPVDLDELYFFLKDYPNNGKPIKQPINPHTDKPYSYIIDTDKKTFTVSGALSNGEEYSRTGSFQGLPE